MRLAGRWYITRRAATQYAAMMFGEETAESVKEARAELAICSETAHFVRREGETEIWRASGEWYRVGFVVGRAPGHIQGALPALIGVLLPYVGWRRPEERRPS